MVTQLRVVSELLLNKEILRARHNYAYVSELLLNKEILRARVVRDTDLEAAAPASDTFRHRRFSIGSLRDPCCYMWSGRKRSSLLRSQAGAQRLQIVRERWGGWRKRRERESEQACRDRSEREGVGRGEKRVMQR